MVAPIAISAALELGTSLISRIWPDPAKQAEELFKLTELSQKGDEAKLNAHVQLMLGQLKINLAEAEHKSIFVAGWRPWIGWVGGIAMAYQFVLYPLLLWVWVLCDQDLAKAPPVMDTGALFAIIVGMLGIGAQRSYDKREGTDTRKMK